MGEIEEREPGQSGDRPIRTAIGLLVIVICIVGVALLAKALFPTDLPSSTNPDFIDNIFDNRAVVWAARLLLVSAAAVLAFGGLFIVVSIGIRMKNGEWLRRAGPFEVSEPAVSEIEGQLAHWRSAASLRQMEVTELTECLEEADEMIERLRNAFASGSMVERSTYDL